MGLVIFDLPLRTPLITHTDTHVTHDVTHTLSDCSKSGAIHAAGSSRPAAAHVAPSYLPFLLSSLQIFTMASTGMVK